MIKIRLSRTISEEFFIFVNKACCMYVNKRMAPFCPNLTNITNLAIFQIRFPGDEDTKRAIKKYIDRRTISW